MKSSFLQKLTNKDKAYQESKETVQKLSLQDILTEEEQKKLVASNEFLETRKNFRTNMMLVSGLSLFTAGTVVAFSMLDEYSNQKKTASSSVQQQAQRFLSTRSATPHASPSPSSQKSSVPTVPSTPTNSIPSTKNIAPAVVLSPEKDRALRLEDKKQWLGAMNKMLGNVQLPMIKELLDFFNNGLVTVRPVPDPKGEGYPAFEFLEVGNKNSPWVSFFPFHEEDVAVNKAFKIFSGQDKTAAHFITHDNMLIVKAQFPMSESWKAIIGAHEGFHAWYFSKTQIPDQSPELFVEEEVVAHNVQNDVASALGGDAYQKLLEQEVKRVDFHINDLGQMIFASRNEYTSELDKVFGKALSSFEKAVRETGFHTHAVFTAIERDSGADKEKSLRRKMSILHQFYVDNGMMQN